MWQTVAWKGENTTLKNTCLYNSCDNYSGRILCWKKTITPFGFSLLEKRCYWGGSRRGYVSLQRILLCLFSLVLLLFAGCQGAPFLTCFFSSVRQGFAQSGWRSENPCLTRYSLLVKPWDLRCLGESILNSWAHSRLITLFFNRDFSGDRPRPDFVFIPDSGTPSREV